MWNCCTRVEPCSIDQRAKHVVASVDVFFLVSVIIPESLKDKSQYEYCIAGLDALKTPAKERRRNQRQVEQKVFSHYRVSDFSNSSIHNTLSLYPQVI